jgi:NADH-quinone oxidoreductase subunit E
VVNITVVSGGKKERGVFMELRTKEPLKKNIYRGNPMATDPPPEELVEILDRFRGQPDALITALEEIQNYYGYLPKKQLQFTARELGFPLSRIYGVATFYNLFQLEPPGRYRIRICKGTACHVGRSLAVLGYLNRKLGIGEDETTPDNLFTLQTVACVGACSLAPVIMVNDRTYGRMTPEKAWEALAHLRAEANEEAY